MKTIRIGIVGFGYMGKMHTLCYQNLAYFYRMPQDLKIELYALAAPHPVENLPVQFQKVYADYRELIADPQVDAVDICTPNYLHKDVLLAAIRANKAIYCEKPLALSLEEAKAVKAAMEEYGYKKTNRVSFEYRFCPAIMRARQLLQEGRIGRIIQFNVKYYGSEFLDPLRPISWQSTKAKAGGGVLYALGTHAIDLIDWLIGDVESVYAVKRTVFRERPVRGENRTGKVELEDILNVLLKCREDVTGTLLLSQVAAGAGIDFAVEIYGEKGSLKFNQENPNVLQYFSCGDEPGPIGGFTGYKAIETMQKYGGEAIFPPPRVNISWIRYHVASIYDFITAVSGDRESHPDLLDAYRVQMVTDAVYASAEAKKEMEISR